jgi:hypothetical protein
VRDPEAGAGDCKGCEGDDQRERAAVPQAPEPVVEARGVDGRVTADDGEVVLIHLAAGDVARIGHRLVR